MVSERLLWLTGAMNAFNLLSSDTIHGVKNGTIVGCTVNFSNVQNCSKTIPILVGVIGVSFELALFQVPEKII
jgi:hypothetical protein